MPNGIFEFSIARVEAASLIVPSPPAAIIKSKLFLIAFKVSFFVSLVFFVAVLSIRWPEFKSSSLRVFISPIPRFFPALGL